MLGINKYILIGENILNFHYSDDSYYEEWFDDNGDNGWIVLLNFREHVLKVKYIFLHIIKILKNYNFI